MDDNVKVGQGASIQEIPFICGIEDIKIVEGTQTSKKRVFRNVLILCVTYLLFFTGFWSLTNLQSTMNASQGIGVESQAIIYLCSMASCFLSDLAISKVGCKTTCAIALLLSCPYFAANLYLRWDTMIICSVLYGFASGPLNAAINFYLDEMCVRFKAASGESRENVSAFFFGLFMFFSEFTQVIGNTLSYYIMVKDHPPPPMNFSTDRECGIHFNQFADNVTNSNLDPPSDHDRYMVVGTFLVLGLLGAIGPLFLDPLKNDIKPTDGCRSVMRRISSAARHLKNPHQLLLLPLTIFLGMEGPFYSADFTEVRY